MTMQAKRTDRLSVREIEWKAYSAKRQRNDVACDIAFKAGWNAAALAAKSLVDLYAAPATPQGISDRIRHVLLADGEKVGEK